jgi:hypothetical protein
VDAVLLKAVREIGLSVSFKAAFPRPDYDEVVDPDEHARLLEQSVHMSVALTRERNGLKKHKVGDRASHSTWLH